MCASVDTQSCGLCYAVLLPTLRRTMAVAMPYYGRRYRKASNSALYHCIVRASSAVGDLATVAGRGCETDAKGTIT